MLKGKYTKKPKDYSTYQVKLFNPFLYDTGVYGSVGCGASALGILTGDNPYKIQEANKNRKHYSDRFMLKYLRDRGFEIIPITQKGVNSDDAISYPIKKNHVCLISQLMAKREASWLVYYNNLLYHNFIIGSSELLDFINKPTLTCYIVWHKRWGNLID